MARKKSSSIGCGGLFMLALVVWGAWKLVAVQVAISEHAGPSRPPQEVQRIVSLAPSTTEMLFAIGAGAEVVGRSLHCDFPPEVAALPSMGSGLEPNIEAVLAAQPTLVVITEAQSGLPAVQALRDADIGVVEVPDVDLADVTVALGALGEATGHAAEAGAVASAFSAQLDAISEAVAGMRRPRTLLAVGRDPLFVAGPDTRLGQLLERVGATNALDQGEWISADAEVVLSRQPELIVDASGGDLPWWSERFAQVPAVRSGRVCVVDADRLARPGPRLAEAALELAICAHPELDAGSLRLVAPRSSDAAQAPVQREVRRSVAPANRERPARVRVASWNIAWLRADPTRARGAGRGQGQGVRTEADHARLRGVAEAVGADVFVLQEVEGAEAATHVFDPAEWEMIFADEGDVQRVGVVFRRGIDVTNNGDLEALDVGDVRRGVDVTIHLAGGDLRLLGVHLKSGCFSGDYTRASDRDCAKFARQVPIVEQWIEARHTDGAAFMVAGDFNRRLAPTDAMWREIDDGTPAGLDLVLATEGRRQGCWESRYPDYIDHFVYDAQAARMVAADSFAETVYDADESLRDRLSDHCPIAIDVVSP